MHNKTNNNVAPPSAEGSAAASPFIAMRNSFCSLHGFPFEVMQAVEQVLTYEDESVKHEIQATFRLLSRAMNLGNNKMVYAMRKTLEDLQQRQIVCWLDVNEFPTGHLDLVRGVIDEFYGTPARDQNWYQIRDQRQEPSNFITLRWYNHPYPPRYYQKEMSDLAIDRGRGVFESAVGTGKTLIMTYIIKHFSVKTLIIVPSRPLLQQIGDMLSSAFGKDKVDQVNSAALKRKQKLKPIRITTVQTLAALQKRGEIHKVLGYIDMLIVDEVHHAGAESYLNLLPDLDHVFYRFGFTGTFLRNDSKTLDMWGFLSNKLYEYLPKQATEEGFLTPVQFHINKIEGRPHNIYQKEYALNYCGTGPLLSKISDLLDEIPNNEQVLILVNQKEKAGEVISNYLNRKGLTNVYISGDNKKEYISQVISEFNEKRIRILVGSKVIGEGIDIHSTQHLILATGGKSTIQIVQAIGRCVRLHPGKALSHVYDFYMENTKYMEKHAKQRIQIYQTQFSGNIEWR